MKLGERLAALGAFVPQGARLADIGTDHGYLPIELIQKKIAISAVAGDIHKGPYQAAKDNIESLGLEEKISVRFGNGLAVLSPGEVDTVVIAGMGGSTIIEILKSQPEVTSSVTRLILQPMIAAVAVRSWLTANKWCIVDEALVQDEGRLYEIIVAEQGVSPEFESIMYDIGMILWKKKPKLLGLHLDHLIAQTERVLREMANSDSAQQSSKFDEYTKRLEQLEAKRQCL
ncbi:tRNA (adenine(22)-N(1))-methyltransferase [Pelosinus sp. sgz500959]|uniref:tRNA (adenine(22)-N(1))-methyltransferase n=1 Tax=Pelosinus sp. sgz500959 TaxID=3242472 RepID=UPI00366D18F4